MLSKNKVSFLTSLSQKKFRDEHHCFIAEGTRLVTDLHGCFSCRMVVATETWATSNVLPEATEIYLTDSTTFQKISSQKQPQGILAVYEKKTVQFDPGILSRELLLMLDNVQDPGNLGTILRIADWFGIRHVICSPDTADIYNPKTIQSTMGALARVDVYYQPLQELLTSLDNIPVYGTFLDGDSIYETELSSTGIIVMGNEGNGISPEIEKLVTRKILIPSFPVGQPTSESLNVGVATAIVCAEFRRRMQP